MASVTVLFLILSVFPSQSGKKTLLFSLSYVLTVHSLHYLVSALDCKDSIPIGKISFLKKKKNMLRGLVMFHAFIFKLLRFRFKLWTYHLLCDMVIFLFFSCCNMFLFLISEICFLYYTYSATLLSLMFLVEYSFEW